MGEVHGDLRSPTLSTDQATRVASVMAALSTASRVRILASLREQPSTVGELATLLEMEQPAASQQLRMLRDLGLVVGKRDGRNVVYRLYDSHIIALVDEALRHIEHFTARSPDDEHPEHTHPTVKEMS